MKTRIYWGFILLNMGILWAACEKKSNYPGDMLSPYIAVYDVKQLYKGTDLTLTADLMGGARQLAAMVISDHSGGNLPDGYLVVQDRRRLSMLRGITIQLGGEASAYTAGDSVLIDITGAVLKKQGGILQITGVQPAAVTKVSSGNEIPLNRVMSSAILASPEDYESTLVAIVKGGFNPLPGQGDVLSGDKTLNDGFGNITLHTEPGASFAQAEAPVLANYYGIILNKEADSGKVVPQHYLRTADDLVVLSSTIEIAPVLIAGFMSDVKGGDANYDYIQFMATEDIDFSQTPYAVVTTNNANASTPTGYPAKGWATGGMRTYKFNLTSGIAKKGTFFYVGGAGKTINGPSSTGTASSNWIRAYAYNTNDGEGFGTATTNLLANSGNAFGMAIFQGTDVTETSVPVDVVFVSTGGSLYTPGPPPRGYRITNTDFYDRIDPISLVEQPFYRNGSNTNAFKYNTADQGYFNMLGGVYNTTLGRWTTARAQVNLLLTKQSAITEIEGEGSTILEE